MSREGAAVRRTSRVNAGIPPSKYSPHESIASKKSTKSHSSVTSRLMKELELKKLEAENQLQTELEEKRLEFEQKSFQFQLEQRKLEQLERETNRKLAIIEVQTSLEAEKSLESIVNNSFQSKNAGSSGKKSTNASDIVVENTQPVHEKVTSWLLENNSPFLDQSCRENNAMPPEEFAKVHPDTSQVMREFTTAMTHAFKSITNQNLNDSSKLKLRNVIGKELPTFSGNVEDWPMFISLYRRSVENCAFSNEENLIRLQKALKNEALDAVRSLFVSPENLEDILTTLERRFGRPEFIIESMMNKVKLLPPVNTRYPISFIKFANSVLNLTVTAKSLKMEAYINNPQLLSQLVQKLPEHLQFQWARIVVKKQENMPILTLKDFSEWLQEESSAACLLCKPTTSNPQPITQYTDRKPKTTVFVGSEDPSMRKTCRFCSESSHSIYKCKHFLDLDFDKRWNWVKEKKVCFSCLNSSHRTFNCRNRRRCGVQNCEKYHNRLLHPSNIHGPEELPQHNLQVQEVPSNIITDEKEEETENSACFINEHSLQIHSEYKTVLLRIIPVTVIGTKKSKKIFALFDEGSTVTLMDSNLAEEVGVEGINDPLKMYWTNSTSYTDNESKRVNLKIQGNLTQDIFDLCQVRTVKNLKLPVQSVDVKRLATKWKYLSQFPLVDLREAKPSILIGQDNIDLTIAREVIQGPANAPIISKTKLGWVVHGNSSYFKDRVDTHYSMTCYTKSGAPEDEELKELMNRTILMDNLGVENEEKKYFSEEDKKALQIMEKTCCQLENNHWEIGLLWKTENVILPDSKTTALNRFFIIEKKMQINSRFAEKYSEKIESFVEKGYARLLTSEEAAVTTNKTWYLPHFAVKHPSKPHKFRFVFDAKAKVDGTNLNENLLKGPDLLNSLINVLFNFRQNKIAVMGDIEDMFLRIRIREDNQDSQRFLWRKRSKEGPILIYQMQAMIFGAICSPSCATYVIRQNAKKYAKECPEAAEAIEKYHYMDDYLDSFENEETAIEVVKGVIKIHSRGKFKMTSWISNSSHVMENVPDELRSKNNMDFQKSERTLGLIWSPKDDLLSFSDTFLTKNENILKAVDSPTKREVIKVVMSVYDPLGLLAAFTIQARILMQEVWSQKIGWDDKLSPDLSEKWKSWVTALYKIRNLKIPRWYGLSSYIVEIQLHTFNDGSEKGYASVSYFRMKDFNQHVTTSLVMAKSRVTSLKPMTVPRIELQAALLGSRLAKTIENGHNFRIDKKFFWIDSKIVLSWIKSHPKNYKTFVANRIGEILDNTNSEDWYWLPTKMNVADDATRGLWNIDNFHEWFVGPQFLILKEDAWPQHEGRIEVETNMEKKKIKILVVSDKNHQDSKIFDFLRFSNYLRLVRTTAWLMRFVQMMKHRIGISNTQIHSDELTVEEFEKAEFELIRHSQRECFLEEIEKMHRQKNRRTRGRLSNFNLFMDQNNILRLSGRLDGAQHLNIHMRQPIIMDSKHWMTILLIRHYHKLNHHQGREQVINHLRERFWIINARTAVKTCVSSCMICRKRNAKLETQQMGQMPNFRITPQARAFMITGMDYFGPMTVTIGRRKEKRYGVIFTCMSTRAIHLELASSLTTDSAIMAIRRFACRRGSPSEIHSDNGTNLCGAEKELKLALQELDSIQIQQFCCVRHIKWFKNPPAASHMGGVWERMIRSVKNALKTILTQQSPKEEMLQTLLVEVEYSVNSHPLTYVSSDYQDDEALTPNHFLIGKANGITPPCASTDTDFHLRKQWRIAQRFADLFWKRWLREYVPTLVKRSKWQFNNCDVSEGDIVIVADDSFPRNMWPRGMITRTFPGKDNKVRVVEVKTATGVYRRPITKIILLKPK